MLVKRCGAWGSGEEQGWYLEIQGVPAGQPRYFAVARAWLRRWPAGLLLRLWQGKPCFIARPAPRLYTTCDAIPLPPGVHAHEKETDPPCTSY